MSYSQQQKFNLNQSFINSEDFVNQTDAILSTRFEKKKQTITIKIVRTILVLFGAIWGIPWLESASNCITAIGIQSQFIHIFAKVGILIAVGVDGIWIMLTICDILFYNLRTSLILRGIYKKQTLILIIALIIGIVSCIPGVYASYLFNDGKQKYFALITFAGNLGLATFGFYALIFEIGRKLMKNEQQNEYFPQQLYKNFLRMIQSQNNDQESVIPQSINTFNLFVKYTKQQSLNKIINIQNWKNQLLLFLPFGFAIIVASSQSLIDIVLTSKFFYTQLHFPKIVSIILSCIFTIPGLVVSFYSSRQVMQKILIILLSLPSIKYNYLDHFCRNAAIFISIIAFLISITSPTSGAYITYMTISTEINTLLAWFAAITIVIARFCFSNYTCRALLSKLYLLSIKNDKKRIIEEQNINKIFGLMERINPKYYSQM